MEMAALSLVCLAIGLVIGYAWGERHMERKKHDAPIPVMPDYDPENPMNGKTRRQTVIMCGREWELRQP